MNNSQILVVEDETIIALDIQSRLQNLGFEVEVAASGEEALQKAKDTPLDLILMDIVLPGSIDGIQAAERIHEEFDIPVVYLTAYSDEETLQRAKMTQPFGYLLKPLKDRELRATVEMATYKHTLEKRLKKSEEQYRTLFESLPHPLWVYDVETLGFLEVNDAAVHQYGYSKEEFLAMTIKDIRPTEDMPKLTDALAHLKKGFDLAGIFRHRKKSGQIMYVEILSHPIDFGGKQAEVVLAGDISDRIAAEQMRMRSLRLSALRAEVSVALSHPGNPLRELLQVCAQSVVKHLDAAFARIWTLNKRGDELELEASAGMYTHLDGFHSRVPVGQMKIGLIAAERRPYLTNDVISDPRVGDKEWAKREEMVSFAGYPLMVEERLIGVIAMFAKIALTDDALDALASISELIAQAIDRKHTEAALRKSEERLRQSQRLEAVGQLAGGVAHDFNNLLTAIIGYSDIALMRLKPEDPLTPAITEIKKAGDRAASLTRQLLAFSRKQMLQPRVINLNRIVSEMNKMLHRLIGENIELIETLEAKIGSVKADPGQIEQVILNLAINARDAMPNGGKLTIETGNVFLSENYKAQHVGAGDSTHVMLAISDTGIGMNSEVQSHIFEPFFTTKEAGKGTGLGLSTVYGIVKQSGGNIWVYSELGRGTTFKVYLPRIDEEAEELKKVIHSGELPTGTETILLAEDDEQVRKLTTAVLEQQGYHVLEAANGAAALSICEKHQAGIDLLLSDVIMPELSGPELSEKLRSLRPQMKMLFMSGYTESAIINNRLLGAEANFIHKPFTPAALAFKVREVLDKE